MSCSIDFPALPVTCDGCDNKPYIGENGNWYVGDTDTGVKAQKPAGQDVDNVLHVIWENKYAVLMKTGDMLVLSFNTGYPLSQYRENVIIAKEYAPTQETSSVLIGTNGSLYRSSFAKLQSDGKLAAYYICVNANAFDSNDSAGYVFSISPMIWNKI